MWPCGGVETITRILSRLILPLIVLLPGGAPALAEAGGASGWSISEAKGHVVVIDTAGERAARAGMALSPGATVRTAARASAVLVRGREFVTMHQNAQLRIPLPAERRAGGIIQILQDHGSALFGIGKQKNPHFGVETPYLAAVVKGTTFIITVTGEGASLQVTEGAVEASTRDGGARELVRPGAVAMIAAGDPLRMVIEGEGRRVIDSPARGTSGAGASGAATGGGGSAAPASAPAAAEPPAPAAPGPAAPTTPAPGPLGSSAAPQAGSGPNGGDAWIAQTVLSTPADLGQASGGFVAGEVAALPAVVSPGGTPGRSGDALPFRNVPVSEVPELGANGNGTPGNGAAGSSGDTVIEDGIACALGVCASAGSFAPADPGNGNPGNGGGAPDDPGVGGMDPETGSGRPGNGGRGGR